MSFGLKNKTLQGERGAKEGEETEQELNKAEATAGGPPAPSPVLPAASTLPILERNTGTQPGASTPMPVLGPNTGMQPGQSTPTPMLGPNTGMQPIEPSQMSNMRFSTG